MSQFRTFDDHRPNLTQARIVLVAQLFKKNLTQVVYIPADRMLHLIRLALGYGVFRTHSQRVISVARRSCKSSDTYVSTHRRSFI